MEGGPAAREEEKNADRQCDSDEDCRRGCPPLDGRLHEERADDPEEEEDRPAAGDGLVGESHVASIRKVRSGRSSGRRSRARNA